MDEQQPEVQQAPEQENTLQLQKKSTIDKVKGFSFKGSGKGLYIVLAVVVVIAVLGAVYFLFFSKGGGPLIRPLAIIDLVEEKAELVMNPLTGEMVSGKDAKWADYRPLAVMVNNYLDARPQSGLVNADLVYEVVAEGGITRFLAFYLSDTPEKIGPVRSTRHYYLVLVKELGDAMIMHIGWSPQALVAIESWPVRSLGRGAAEFWRDQDRINAGVPTEHTAYVDGEYLRQLGDELGWQGTRETTAWKFKDDNKLTNLDAVDCRVGECKPITIDFWYEGDYSAIWKYDPDTNTYIRFTGYDADGEPIPHEDQETGEQVRVKNFVIQFAVEEPILEDDKNRLNYELEGSGEGLVFMDGFVIPVTWSKEGRDERTIFYDDSGEEVEFNRGKFWISIVPERNKDQVTY